MSEVDRVADLLLTLETAPAVGFRMVGLAVVEDGAARGVISVQLAGRPFRLSPTEARLVARCIGFEDRRRATGLLVSLFDSAACDAEAMAAILARRLTGAQATGAAA